MRLNYYFVKKNLLDADTDFHERLVVSLVHVRQFCLHVRVHDVCNICEILFYNI